MNFYDAADGTTGASNGELWIGQPLRPATHVYFNGSPSRKRLNTSYRLALRYETNHSCPSPCRHSDGFRLGMHLRRNASDELTVTDCGFAVPCALILGDDCGGMPGNTRKDHAGRSKHESHPGCRR